MCLQKFTQHELVLVCLNNFRHDLSNALMEQSFGCFNDMCTKAHDMEIYLNKCKKRIKEGARTEHSITASVASKERATYGPRSSSSKKVVP